MGSGNMNMEQIRRAASDMVAELHARKLAIPAAVLLVAIVAAVFVLPKSATPTPPEPVTSASAPEVIEQPAQVSLKLVGVTPLDNDIPLANSSDPFVGTDSADCTRVGSGEPKQFDCRIGDLVVRVMCPPTVDGDPGVGICAGKSGSTSSTGSSGSAGGGSESGSTEKTGDGGSGEKKKKSTPKSSYYVATVEIDGKTFSNVVAGDPLPNTSNTLVTYAGTNDSNTRGIFLAGDKVTVTGVAVDDELGSFELAKGKSATLTDETGTVHTMTLKSLKKVTK